MGNQTMQSRKNKNDLEAVLGESESRTLEFKSSRDLGLDKNKAKKFVAEKVARAVSSFLNSDGGVLIIGIEEDRNGNATVLSPGIPRSVMKQDALQNMIVDLIRPPVGDLVGVRAIKVNGSDDDPCYDFCVEVKPGHTAYQSADMLYYARREGQSFPMDDKDIRLRMLSSDRPRVHISVEREIHYSGAHRWANYENELHRSDSPKWVNGVRWLLTIRNIGLKTIPRALIRCKIEAEGLSDRGIARLNSHMTVFGDKEEDKIETGLMPTANWSTEILQVSNYILKDCSGQPSLTANVEVLIDDGFPEEKKIDLLGDIRSLIESEWQLPIGG
jgi:hypothetical protein